MHACAIANDLGIIQIIIPADAGILSAAGIGNAEQEKFAEKQLLQAFEDVKSEIDNLFGNLANQLLSSVPEQGFRVTEKNLFYFFSLSSFFIASK